MGLELDELIERLQAIRAEAARTGCGAGSIPVWVWCVSDGPDGPAAAHLSADAIRLDTGPSGHREVVIDLEREWAACRGDQEED